VAVKLREPVAIVEDTSAIRWKVFALLVIASVVFAATEILAAPLLHIQVTPLLIVGDLLVAAATAAFGAGIGLWLGPSIGWGARELVAWLGRNASGFAPAVAALPAALLSDWRLVLCKPSSPIRCWCA
jgi:hypothetical protein